MEEADREEMERLMQEAGLGTWEHDRIRDTAQNKCGEKVSFNFLDTLGPMGARALALALKGAIALRELALDNDQIGDVGTRALAVEGLKHVPLLETLGLDNNQIGPCGARLLAEEGLKHVPSLHTLKLHDNEIGDAGAYALADQGLKHVPSLEQLDLWDNSLTAEGMVRFLKCLQANLPRPVIRVFETDLKDSAPIARALATLRHLHPQAQVYFTKSAFDDDDFGPTAQSAYQQQLDLLKLLQTGSVPLDTAKAFVCDDYGIGKTTMITSLLGLSSFNALLANVRQPADCPDEARERTPGIKVSELKLSTANGGSSKRACFRIYDFGGQPAYHVVHTLLVSDHNAAFVVCVDLSKPEAEVKKSLWYWLRFICTRLKQGSEAATATATTPSNEDSGGEGEGGVEEERERPRIFIIGTKVDQAHKQNRLDSDGTLQWENPCFGDITAQFENVVKIHGAVLCLNCHRGNDPGFDTLRSMLVDHWSRLKRKQVLVPKVVVQVGEALPAAAEKQRAPWTMEELYPFVRETIPTLDAPEFDEAMFHRTLRYLHVRGDVLWFSNNPALADYVFVSPNWFLHVVMGRALAPLGVNCDGACPNNGVVSYRHLADKFAKHGVSTDLLLEVLQHTHLCFELPPRKDGERWFMLPSRLEQGVNLGAEWKREPNWPIYAGQRLLIKDKAFALPPGFFPHMQTALHDAFGETLQMWRNAFKLTTAGVQCFGLLRGDREVDVWIRAKKDAADNARACLDQVFGVASDLATGIDFETHAISVQQLRRHHHQPASYKLVQLRDKAPSDYATSDYHPKSDPMTEKIMALLLINQTPAVHVRDIPWHPDGYEWWHDQWRLDDAFDQRLQWTGPGQHKMYTAPLPEDSDLYRWIALEVNTGHGVTLSRVEVVKSATMLAGFKFRVEQTAERLQNPNSSNPFRHSFGCNSSKQAMLDWFEASVKCKATSGFVSVLPLWHGCSETVVDDIIAAGTANLSGPADPGFFGTGIYLARQASYAAGYASKLAIAEWAGPNANGEHMLLLCAVSVGSVCPITRDEDYKTKRGNPSTWCNFYGQKLHRGCDTHYAQVTAASGFQATDTPGTFNFEEVVVNQEAQVLPFAKVFVRVDRTRLHRYLTKPPSITMPQPQPQQSAPSYSTT